jgi:hypothetical protein
VNPRPHGWKKVGPVGRSGRLSRSIHQGSIRSANHHPRSALPTGPGPGRGTAGPARLRGPNACSPGEGREARWQSRSLDGRRREWAEVPITPWMTRVTHRTRSESERHVRGPGRTCPSPRTRIGTRITLGLGAWRWGEPRGHREPGCWTLHPEDRPGAVRLRRVADPLNAEYLRVMRTAARIHPQALPEGAGGRSRPAQSAPGHPRPR